MHVDKRDEYVRSLVLKLYNGIDYYFHGDELNSEGWKVFNEIIYHVMRSKPWYRKRIRDLRRRPRAEDIFAFTSEAYGVPSNPSGEYMGREETVH